MADISDNTVFGEVDASNVSATMPTWPEGMLPSAVNNNARALQGALKRFFDHINPTVTSGGSANAQTLTYSVAPAAYVLGDVYTFIVGASLANTGATTLDVNGLGAKNVLIAGSALQAGCLRPAQVVSVGYDGTQFQLIRPALPANAYTTPSNPGATTSTTAVMMGLAGAITPNATGQVKIWINGNGSNASATDDFIVQIRYGTGTAPTNGAALTGTGLGGNIQGTCTDANDFIPFCLVGMVSGLTVGTAYWVDVSLASGVGGSATLEGISMLLEEMTR